MTEATEPQEGAQTLADFVLEDPLSIPPGDETPGEVELEKEPSTTEPAPAEPTAEEQAKTAERRKRKVRSEKRIEQLVAQRRELEEKLAQTEAAKATALKTQEEQRAQFIKFYGDQLDAHARVLLQQKAMFMEQGETAKVIEVDEALRQISKTQALLASHQASTGQSVPPVSAPQPAPPPATNGGTPPQQAQKLPKAQVLWMEAVGFSEWPQEDQMVAAVAFNKLKATYGYTDADEEVYELLDKRLQRKFPQYYADESATEEDEDTIEEEFAPVLRKPLQPAVKSPKVRTSPVATPSRASRPASKYVISREEQETMRSYGLDPTDPKVQADWITHAVKRL